MGCILSTTTEPNQNESECSPINQSKVHKILILGTSGSGKSTTFRAIQYINNQVEDEGSMNRIKLHIREMCIDITLDLIEKSDQFYEQKFISNDDRTNIDNHLDILEESRVHLENASIDQLGKICKSIEYIWNLTPIKETYSGRYNGEYAHMFSDNSDYYLNNIQQIMNVKWIPTQEHCLKARLITIGINRCEYTAQDAQFQIFDIGTRPRRRNWLHCFDTLSRVIVVIGLNDYCKLLWEDESTNALSESFELFEEICNVKYFRKTNIVLFLNKKDLLKESLRITPLTYLFGDEYKGRNFEFCDGKLQYKLVFNLLPKLLVDEMIIPLDVINIIAVYFDIKEEWLDLCVFDSIEFVKKKCQTIHSNSKHENKLRMFSLSVIYLSQTEDIMNEIEDNIINSVTTGLL